MNIGNLSVRGLFACAVAAAMLSACSGGGSSPVPATGVQAQSASRSAQGGVITGGGSTPTPAPTTAPDTSGTYTLVTAVAMDQFGGFSEASTSCDTHASLLNLGSNISFGVAPSTVLPVCTTGDGDGNGRHDDALHPMAGRPTTIPSPTPGTTPTPAPGAPTNYYIIRVDGSNDSDRGDDAVIAKDRDGGGDGDGHGHTVVNPVVLAGPATVSNGQWTFAAIAVGNNLLAGVDYRFYVAQKSSDDDGHHHHHHGDGDGGDHDGGDGDHGH